MTRKGRTLDFIDYHPPLRRIIERGPFAAYARCEDCGADAGTECMGLDNKPAIEVCPGRRIEIDDTIARTGLDKKGGRRRAAKDMPVSQTPEAKRHRERTGRKPKWAACQHCAIRTRLLGAAYETGRTWCDHPTCQRAKELDRSRREAARQRAEREQHRAAE